MTSTIIEVIDRIVVLAQEEKQPVATAIFGAALFSARLRAASANPEDRETILNSVLFIVDGLLATHEPATGH